MTTLKYHEPFEFKVDLFDYFEIEKLEKELTEQKITYNKKTINKHNNRTEFQIYTTIYTIINKPIKNLQT